MQTNTPSSETSNEEASAMVGDIIEYLQHNPFGAVDGEINGAPCLVIAAVEGEKMESVQPMFIIPTPELILHIVDPEDKKAIFAIATPNLN